MDGGQTPRLAVRGHEILRTGPCLVRPPVREGRTTIDRHHIRKAVEGACGDCGPDYIDLYQTHWPDHDLPTN